MAWTTPRTWVAGEVVTAALMNVHVRDNLDAIGGAWTAFTPTFTNLTVGNGVLDCAHRTIGKTIIVRYHLAFGSTSSVAGNISVTLPVAPKSPSSLHMHLGGHAFDASTGLPYTSLGGIINATSGTLSLAREGGFANATTPITWAVSDYFSVTGVYEAA